MTVGQGSFHSLVRCLGVGFRLGGVLAVAGSMMACAGLPMPVQTPEEQTMGSGQPAAAPGPEGTQGVSSGIDYRVSIAGVSDETLVRLIEGASLLVTLKDRPPPSLGGLRRRAKGDIEPVVTALRSEGYYAGTAEYRLDRSVRPIEVTLTVTPGERYRLAEYKIRYKKPIANDVAPGLEDVGLEIGMPARAPAIVAAQQALLASLARRGYPSARVLNRQTFVKHTSGEMTVELDVDAGPFTRFGPVSIDGPDADEAAYVKSLLTWKEGEPYDQDKVESTRNALAATALYASIEIVRGEKAAADGNVPMMLTLTQASRRTVGFGASYSTSEGIGGEAYWEHRSLFGRNEKLRLAVTVAEIEQVLTAEFSKPGFLRKRQSLLVETTLANRNTDAYSEQTASASVGIARPWRENWRVSAGVSGEYSIVDENDEENEFQLLGFPLAATRDTTDNPLNPMEGSRFNFSLTPYVGRDGSALFFTEAITSASSYYAIDDDGDFVLAGRAKLGSVFGEETGELPANKRLFSGGGGSIRGYAYQSVGPLDEQGDPIGGRSLLEIKGELRIRATETIGLVPFVDGGSVFDSVYPDFEEPVRWAAGLGLRYFTDFGPIRLDVATPINGRDTDDNYQFYISIGQAF